MGKLKLGPMADNRAVKVTVELHAVSVARQMPVGLWEGVADCTPRQEFRR
ncbi:DUF2274 domain-containing protein [Bradyrhizobium sp. S3.9.1]